MSTDLPDFKIFCRDACIKLWGEPDRETPKELRWNGGDAYSVRTFNPRKQVWYDAGAEMRRLYAGACTPRHGQAAARKGSCAVPMFIEAWATLFELGLVPIAACG